MCRLYCFRANEATKVECTLVHAQNALMSQSRSDRRGVSHPDGWGISYYEDSVPEVERRATPAYEDLHFSATAERVFAHTVVAHVRLATVGGAAMENTHPFVWGAWTFAHNGTIRVFDRVGPAMDREVDSHLRSLRVGRTDSEMAFYWLLSRLAAGGVDIGRPGADLCLVRELLGDAVVTLDAWCREAGADKPARLNFLLADGRSVVASRLRNDLYYLERDGVRDCEICGIPHVHHHAGIDYRAVVLASEPITDEAWAPVPEGHVLAVDDALAVSITPMDAGRGVAVAG